MPRSCGTHPAFGGIPLPSPPDCCQSAHTGRSGHIQDEGDRVRAKQALLMTSMAVGLVGVALGATGKPARAAEAGAPALPPGLELLRRTERAFAKSTAEIGIRNGFLMFFAPDAISPPGTGSAWTRFASRPAYVEPPVHDLVWEPLYGDVAKSVDLGYLTGPLTHSLPDGKKNTGTYFSVWRRSPEGLWRVVFDAGIDMPSAAPEFADGVFHPADVAAWKVAEGTAAATPDDLKRAESAFLAAARTGARQAYAGSLGAHARMHRDGSHPILGRDAILAQVDGTTTVTAAEVLKVDVSSAGDLGWTFGTATESAGGKAVRGTFMRVWRRDDQGRWRIAVDLVKPEPEEAR